MMTCTRLRNGRDRWSLLMLLQNLLLLCVVMLSLSFTMYNGVVVVVDAAFSSSRTSAVTSSTRSRRISRNIDKATGVTTTTTTTSTVATATAMSKAALLGEEQVTTIPKPAQHATAAPLEIMENRLQASSLMLEDTPLALPKPPAAAAAAATAVPQQQQPPEMAADVKQGVPTTTTPPNQQNAISRTMSSVMKKDAVPAKPAYYSWATDTFAGGKILEYRNPTSTAGEEPMKTTTTTVANILASRVAAAVPPRVKVPAAWLVTTTAGGAPAPVDARKPIPPNQQNAISRTLPSVMKRDAVLSAAIAEPAFHSWATDTFAGGKILEYRSPAALKKAAAAAAKPTASNSWAEDTLVGKILEYRSSKNIAAAATPTTTSSRNKNNGGMMLVATPLATDMQHQLTNNNNKTPPPLYYDTPPLFDAAAPDFPTQRQQRQVLIVGDK